MRRIFEKIKLVDFDIITTFLLTFVFLSISLTSALFLIGVNITNFHFLVFLLFSSFITYIIISNKSDKFQRNKIIINIMLSICILFFTIMIANVFYDNTWDGNTYHKEMIGLMKNGMNPVYNSESGDIWVQHYARAVETFSAVIYSFTGNIESGKALNFIFILILFAQIIKFGIKRNKNIVAILCLAIVVALNPISIVQSTTYYVDGIFANVLFFIMLLLLDFALSKKICFKTLKGYWLAMLIVICINIKFTALLICTMFIGIFCLYYLYKANLNKKFWECFKKMFIYFLIVYFFAIVIVGESVYVKNYIEYGHPFYPLKGENTGVDIVTGNEPAGLENYSHIKKFVYTLFSKTYTWYDKKPELKVPFSVYRSEFESMQYADVRIGGFGPLYSGILLISLPIIFYYIIKKILKKEKSAILLVLFLLAEVLPIPILPVVWQLRYYPQLYLLPISAIILILEDKQGIIKKLYSYIILLTLLTNILLFVPIIFEHFKYSVKVNKQLIYLYEQSQVKDLIVSVEDCPNAGARYNLLDKNINYKFLNEKMDNGEPMYYRFFYRLEERK